MEKIDAEDFRPVDASNMGEKSLGLFLPSDRNILCHTFASIIIASHMFALASSDFRARCDDFIGFH